MKRSHLILILLIASTNILFSQDPQFSQTFISNNYNAPSYAGFTKGSRLTSIYRNQWPSIPDAYVTYMFSGDFYFDKQKSGVGLLILRDIAGEGTINSTTVNLQYAYNIKINNQYEIRPALQAAIVTRGIDYNKLIFKDQLLSGNSTSSIETFPDDKIIYPDFKTSLLLYSSKNWFGFSMDHLFRPNISFLDQENFVSFNYTLFGGLKFDVNGGLYSYKDEYLQFSYLYKHQQKFDQIDMGLFLQKKEFGFGMHYRGIPIFKQYKNGYANNDAIILILGFRQKKYQVHYSFDFTISRLFNYSGNAHEISLIYDLFSNNNYQKKAKKKVIDCPKYIDSASNK